MAPAVYSWTGCYVGVNGGFGRQLGHDADIVLSFGPNFQNVGTFNPQGGFGGGQVGCNLQTGSIVFGLEADFQGSGIRGHFGPNFVPSPPEGGFTVSGNESLRWFDTIRGRLGWTADRMLLYVTGGLAYGRTDYSVHGVDDVGNTIALTRDETRTGYVVGGGFEWAFSGAWSIKAEYQYINLRTIGPISTNVIDPAGVRLDDIATTRSFRNDYNTVRLGVNYRFGSSIVGLY